jgi:hypothetical protein
VLEILESNCRYLNISHKSRTQHEIDCIRNTKRNLFFFFFWYPSTSFMGPWILFNIFPYIFSNFSNSSFNFSFKLFWYRYFKLSYIKNCIRKYVIYLSRWRKHLLTDYQLWLIFFQHYLQHYTNISYFKIFVLPIYEVKFMRNATVFHN